MDKIYISAEKFQRDSWRLAESVVRGGWRPDAIFALWRGGAAAGVCVHEYMKARGVEAAHYPVKCRSYSGIGESGGNVVFDCAGEVFKTISPGMKILAVDDVFDSGRTALALKERICGAGGEMRFAAVYWKSLLNATTLKPDYFVEDAKDAWLVFPHEIDGLSGDEIAAKDAFLAALLDGKRFGAS